MSIIVILVYILTMQESVELMCMLFHDKWQERCRQLLLVNFPKSKYWKAVNKSMYELGVRVVFHGHFSKLKCIPLTIRPNNVHLCITGSFDRNFNLIA